VVCLTDLGQIFIFILAFFGLFFGMAILLVYITNRSDKKTVEKQPQQPEVKEKVIIKEVVMIPCQYCGTLVPQTAQFCPNCGAPNKKTH
jgi:uncharacterized membrane protein